MAATTEPKVDATVAGAASAAAAAAGKKKKKVADNTKYQGVEAVMPISLKSSHAKGRHAVAARDLAAGTLVTVEKAAGAIVRNQSFVTACHACFGPVSMKTHTRPKMDAKGQEVKGQKERFQAPAFSCEKCKMAAYCSEQCKTAHGEEHGVQCAALAKCNAIAGEHKVPLEHLRAVLALLGRRAVQKTDGSPEFGASASEAKAMSYADVLDLNPNRHYIDRDSIKDLQQALRDVLALVPEAARISASEAVEVACIFNSNNHSLFVNQQQQQQVLALFPFASLYFPHSCAPNCVFLGERNGTLVMRTLADVPKGGDLSISYVELYQPREQRRRDLLLTRHFWCKCKRCSMALSQSVDRLMDGIQCSGCQKGVMIFEETKEVQDINELMTDISALDQEIQGKFAKCENCAAEIEVTKLVDVLKSAITDFGTAYSTMQQGQLSRARVLMEKFVADYETKHVLNPFNSYLVNNYTSLARVCTQLDDVDRAIRYTTVVIERMTEAKGSVPTNYPRLAEYYMSLGDMCLKQAKKKAANKTPAGRSITRRYLKEAKTALENAHSARSVIFGEDSPRAKEAARLLESAKKENDEYAKTADKKKPKKQLPAASKQQQPTPATTSA
ncbi:hypothetical protein GGF46_003209 [Coemansia sp. RSA 552]|nr:hypothetical protein GGF46_003209 [Coemansia sp. RSA 552]